MLKSWRANTDCQPILTIKAALGYVTKYIAKAEQCSKPFSKTLKKTLEFLEDGDPTRKLCQKFLHRVSGDHDQGAPEVMMMLCQLPLIHSSRIIENVPLDGFQPVAEVPKRTWMQKYCQRNQLLNNVSLSEFVKTRTDRGYERRKHAIVKFTPKRPPRDATTGEISEEWAKNELTKFIPWRISPESLKGNHRTWGEAYIASGLPVPQPIQPAQTTPGSNQQHQPETEADDDDDDGSDEETELRDREPWMLASTSRPGNDQIQEAPLQIDINNLPEGYLDDQREGISIADGLHFLLQLQRDQPQQGVIEFDPATLNDKQKLALDIFVREGSS